MSPLAGVLPDPAEADVVLADWGVPLSTSAVPASAGVLGFVQAHDVDAGDEGARLSRVAANLVLFTKRGAVSLAPETVVTLGSAGSTTDYVVLGPVAGPGGLFARWWVVPRSGGAS
jgi:hypothetical protein